MNEVKNRYDEVFKIEIEGWCFGIENYPGEITASILHRIIRELAISFEAAIQHNVVFDLLEISSQFSKAAKYLVHEREIAFSILGQLPNPSLLDEERQYVLGAILSPVEDAYGGALERFNKKWRPAARKRAA